MKYKKLLVLGGTGGVGNFVVQMALERGHEVTALIRPESDLASAPNLDVVKGDILDPAILSDLAKGKDAIVSCLGIRRKSASNPWSALMSAADFTERGAKIMVDTMHQHKISRVIAISAAGVGESLKNTDAILRFLFRNSKLKYTLADSEKMEAVFEKNGLDWLAVRPVRLIDASSTNRTVVLNKVKASAKICRSDVAQWMLDALERPKAFDGHTEAIGWR